MRDADATQWPWTPVVPVREKENALGEGKLDARICSIPADE